MRNIFSIIAGILCFCGGVYGQEKTPSDFAVKAFYIDCRAQVMTVSAIKKFAEDLSKKGINALLIEYEATFPFEKHATLCNSFAYSRQDIKEIVDYCGGLGIEVIPLQNCFGHCEYILRHDRYIKLREDWKEVSQVCPLKIKEAKRVFGEIFREVAALHPSKYFHIGADETYLLGSCKECSKKNKSRLFVDYVKAMCEIVEKMGKTPMIWADIILKHPEVAGELPKNLIYVDWNYGWDPNRFGNLDNIFKLGAKVWGATALRSSPDNVYLTDWKNHFDNIKTFIPFARAHGYEGIVQTSWSTSGTYGFHYDLGCEILEMYPIRQVYPMSGFQILVDAFCKAAAAEDALDTDKFILSYAAERYGLSEKDSSIFLSYFNLPQARVRGGRDANGVVMAQLLKDIVSLKGNFDKIAAHKNAEEFAHYRLMLDLRVNYLLYKQIEFEYNSQDYDISKAEGLLKRLEAIMAQSDKLSESFLKLNDGYLKPGQLKDINSFRTKKMGALYGNLCRQVQICKKM